ncbi:MAG: alpha/beta fold hydrolase, partial [Mycobacterium sp.]|nr:alpha/beta fold hydrolase [Mycobacterium sp.]
MHVLRNLPGMKIPAGAGAALRLSVIGAVVAVFLCGFAVSPHADADPESASLLKWVPCPGHEEVQCSELSVPLDPAAPELGTISLALARRPATDPSARIGSLVLEPGGPGLSGVEEVLAGDELSTPEVAARYDIVGFDPRGVGRSEPLWCFTEEQIGRYLDELAGVSWDLDPSTPQVAAFAQTAASFGQGCQADNPALLQRVGTRYAAADLDLIRAALGD